jgi:hypothetical protein
MSLKSLGVKDPFEASFSEGVRRAPQKGSAKSFIIALLLVVSLLTFITTMLLHYPQKVDAFLNSDNPTPSRQVVTSNK